MNNISKVYSKIIIAVLCLSCLSCGPYVYFKEALPPHIESVSEIPDKYCGMYFFESDSSLITVRPDAIMTESIIKYRTVLSKVEESENCKIVDGGLHLKGREECFPFEYITDDSIVVRTSEMDTLFSFVEGQELKFYDDMIFLNFLNATDEWITLVLKEEASGLVKVYNVLIDNDEELINSITSNYTIRYKLDSTEVFIIDPTAAEFPRIMRSRNLIFFDNIIPVVIETDNHEK